MQFGFGYGNYRVEITLTRKKRRPPDALTVFNYHQIGRKFLPGIHTPGTFTETPFFEEQLRHIAREYRVISLAEGIAMLNEGRLDDRYAAITVDDGDRSVLEMVPIFRRLQMPATFFVNSGNLDNRSSYWYPIYNFVRHHERYRLLLSEEIEREIGQLRHTTDRTLYRKNMDIFQKIFEEIREDFNLYLTGKELEDIDGSIFDIAPHGYLHERFSMMDESWQRHNLKKDIEFLRRYKNYRGIFGIPFGRPGDWTHTTIRLALEEGLQIVFADGGINTAKEVGYRRIPADGRVIGELKL